MNFSFNFQMASGTDFPSAATQVTAIVVRVSPAMPPKLDVNYANAIMSLQTYQLFDVDGTSVEFQILQDLLGFSVRNQSAK